MRDCSVWILLQWTKDTRLFSWEDVTVGNRYEAVQFKYEGDRPYSCTHPVVTAVNMAPVIPVNPRNRVYVHVQLMHV